jgi:hypothetical protein
MLDHAFMASIRREMSIETSLDDAWDALRDWGALHERLARGFVIDTRVEGRERLVTFFNGMVLRERIVTVDDNARLVDCRRSIRASQRIGAGVRRGGSRDSGLDKRSVAR